MSASEVPAAEAVRGQKARHLAGELRRGIAELRWPGGKLPTEQQLAREQGVSLNTVRRAVDLLVQDGLVYRRQGSGMYIASSDTGPLVGVAVPSMTYYFPRIIVGIERELARHGAQMLLRSTEWDSVEERQAVDGLVSAGAAGLILAADGPSMAGLEDLDVPVVLVERGLEDPTTLHEFVGSNHAAGARAAVQHLRSLGHTRIGYLERVSPHTAPQVRAGLGDIPVLVESRERWTTADAERFLAELLRKKATAVICFADREATLLLNAALANGISVPGELSVISYDDEVADLSDVPLTAVSPAKFDVGRLAVETLRARLADPASPRRQISLIPDLVVRDSTGPVSRP
ncbi:GntR family transcriptional regulator [Kribbella voronezhensis]|uniref:GntR family transcriptional regulator n=1 Tax=Kribbella voronezhensis TaxID=2512212 RepID=A0A4R7TG93_9ACTN|nr:GntR family transcriptional regulator [Kribbella voronezhensis]TDU91240.1 GntR family transcriptional regulator [Kribbella voronezhensis]